MGKEKNLWLIQGYIVCIMHFEKYLNIMIILALAPISIICIYDLFIVKKERLH